MRKVSGFESPAAAFDASRLTRIPSTIFGPPSTAGAAARENGSPVVNACWNVCGVPPSGRNSAIAM